MDARTATKTPPGPLGALEYVLRLAFFLVAPFVVVVLSELVPMTAAIVNIGLALAAFFFGEILRAHAQQKTWIGRLLRGQLAFEAYYREHPPKPFVYYLFYPLLLPYWLFKHEARQEFLLFKGYTVAALLFMVATGAYRLAFVYAPELGAKDFAGPFAVGVFIESLAVLMLIMPMTTSVVALHGRGQHKRLVALLAVGLVSAGLAATWLAVRHRTFPSFETRYRVAHRVLANRPAAAKAMNEALHAAWKKRHDGGWGREDDGILEGPPVEAARRALDKFFREDEAAAFEIWTSARTDKVQMMVLYSEGVRKGRPTYLGMRPDGTIVKRAEIPKPTRELMRSVGELGSFDDL